MLNYLLQRLATIIPTLFFVSVLIFGLQQLLPGDPAIALAGEDRDPNVVAYLRAKFHLDEPLPMRYGYWLGGVPRGHLGVSVRLRHPGTALMRHTRSAMLQVLSSDYVRTARAKGLDERTVVLKHALRNALIPIITLGALEFGTLLSGAVLTEQVFSIPGFGKLIVDAVFNRDYSVVQGVVLFTATVYITLNLLADMAYFLVNPRMRG